MREKMRTISPYRWFARTDERGYTLEPGGRVAMESQPLTLIVISDDSSALRSQLEAVAGLRVDVTEERETPSPHDVLYKSELPELTTITVVAIRVLPTIVSAVRDILMEHLRRQRRLLIVRQPDGTVITYLGGTDDPKQIEELERETSKRLLSRD